MLTPIKKSIFQLAAPPEAFLSGLTVVDSWSLAVLATPVMVGAAVASLRAHAKEKNINRSELEETLRDFCEGR